MNHGSPAFLSAVVRFLSLHFAPRRQWTDEYARLLRWLQEYDEELDEANRLPWQRRPYRRVALQDVGVLIWVRSLALPGNLIEVSANEARLTCRENLPPTLDTAPFVLSCLPPAADVRIDLPVRVVEFFGDSEVKVEFCGAPLVLHRRLNRPIIDHHSRDVTEQDEAAPVRTTRLSPDMFIPA